MVKEFERIIKTLERIEKSVDGLEKTVNRLNEMSKRMLEYDKNLSKCPHPYAECHLKNILGELSWRIMEYHYKKVGELYCEDCPYLSPLFEKPIFLSPSRE